MPRPVTIADTVSFRTVSNAAIHPDGDIIVYALSEPFGNGGNTPRSRLWVVKSDGGRPRPFTADTGSDTMPLWSPDGSRLAFLSDRESDLGRQVYVMHRSFGEAERLTSTGGRIAASAAMQTFAWSPDGTRIAFLMTEPETDEASQRKAEGRDHIRFEKEPNYNRIYVVDLTTGEIECASPAGLQIWEFGWSPDGEYFAAVASDEPYKYDWYLARLVRFRAGRSGPAQTLHQTKRQLAKPNWSPDGTRIAFLSSIWSDQGAVGGSVFVMPADGGDARELQGSRTTSPSWTEWSQDGGTLYIAGHERGGSGIALLDVETGTRTQLWHTEGAIGGGSWPPCSRDCDGNFAVIVEDAHRPAEVHRAKPKGGALALRKLTDLHPQASELELGRTEMLHWNSSDGQRIQGLLIRPTGEYGDGPWPLIVDVHGGPASMHANRYVMGMGRLGWLQHAASRGMAVFMPNPRGSTGWGVEFTESNLNDLGGMDWEDVLAGVDHCIAIGAAKEGRLGITGWSYGGFLSGWALTQSDRFSACAIGAAAPYRRSWHGNSGIKNWVGTYLGYPDPWDPDGAYRHYSFISHIKNAKMPTLIMHGDRDADVPIEQAHMLYRALKEHGVETEFVYYPGGGHGISQRDQVMDIGRRVTAWFEERL